MDDVQIGRRHSTNDSRVKQKWPMPTSRTGRAPNCAVGVISFIFDWRSVPRWCCELKNLLQRGSFEFVSCFVGVEKCPTLTMMDEGRVRVKRSRSNQEWFRRRKTLGFLFLDGMTCLPIVVMVM
eukprot:scaffold2296_cov853-Pavlova_lutheri.AAC.8